MFMQQSAALFGASQDSAARIYQMRTGWWHDGQIRAVSASSIDPVTRSTISTGRGAGITVVKLPNHLLFDQS